MKRWVAVAGIALCLSAARVEALEIGIGLVGGATVPLAQSDNASGGQLGVHDLVVFAGVLRGVIFFES